MKLKEPKLILKFLGNDLKTDHHEMQIATKDNIIMHSVSLEENLLSGMMPASNRAHLQLNRKTPCIEDIISTDGDIKALLQDGNTPIFTGYLSTNYSWEITEHGEQALEITIEDVGTRLLGKPFRESGRHLFNCSVDTAIRAICQSAGIMVSRNCKVILDKITATIDCSMTCKDLLTEILYEIGYVYYFDAEGELNAYELNCTSTEGITVLDGEKLYEVDGFSISLTKNIRQYRSSRISYTGLAEYTSNEGFSALHS